MGPKLIIIFCIAVAVSAIPFGSSSKANEEIEEISKFKANKPSAFRIINNKENDEEDENYTNSYPGSENKEPAPVVEINKLDTPTNKLLPFHVPDHRVEDGDEDDVGDNESDYEDDESDDEYDESDEKHNIRKVKNENKRDNPAPVVELVEDDKPLNGELPFHVPVKKEITESEIDDLVKDENEELNEDDSPIDEQNSFYSDTVKKNVKNREKYADNYEDEPAPVVEIDDHDTPKDKELPFHVPEERENIEKASDNESEDEKLALHQKENRNDENDNSEEENKEEESDDDINGLLEDEGEDFSGPTHYKLPYLFDAEEHHKPHKEKQTYSEVKSEINALERFDEPIHYKFPVNYYTETRKDHTETKKAKRSRYDDEAKKQAPSEELNQTPSPNYEFQYSINDSESGDVKNVKEARDGDAVQGSYSFIQPDGLERIVEYTADKENGFNAVVRYKEAPIQPMIKPIEHRDNPIPKRRSHKRYPASYSNFQYAAPISKILSFPNSVTSFSASQNKN